ncbi:MAG TPA: type VI secretion system contractile sheath large subunit [Candidatus Sulfotelmatobacter sp.]|nr:type VI secretion system contractile sheath large subunit [Candidatus Sulfotelmatobacter sp.]
MKPLGWKIVVVTDVGVDPGERRRVTPAEADTWLASLNAGADVPAKAGGASVRMPLTSPTAFEPPAVAAWLAAQGAPNGADAVDAVLHHPSFQRVEAAWRGMKLLLAQAGDRVEIRLASMPRKNLAARFKEVVFLPEYHEAEPPSLIALDFEFGYKGDDLATLNELGSMAKVLQAPVVAQASAGFFDFRYLVQIATLGELLPRLMDSNHSGWKTFQTTDPARWITLTINRWLARAPYTAEAGGHAEKCAESNPDSYLWARGVWFAAAAVARSVNTYGHALAIAGAQGGRFDNLPTRLYPGTKSQPAPLAAEAPFAEMQVMELMRAGFAPIVAPMSQNLAMLASAMSIFRLRPATPTIEGTLAYQLLAGRLAQTCARILDSLPGGDANATAAFVREQLLAFLGPLAGDAPDQAVQVAVREEEMDGKRVRFADVKVAPRVMLEGKPADFSFLLPLGN